MLDAIEPWVKMIVNQGTTVVVAAFFLWMLAKFLPKWVDGSIKSQNEVPGILKEVANNMQGLRADIHVGVDRISGVKENIDDTQEEIARIRTAVHHSVAAAKILLEEQNRNKDSDVVIELSKAQDATDKNVLRYLKRQEETKRKEEGDG